MINIDENTLSVRCSVIGKMLALLFRLIAFLLCLFGFLLQINIFINLIFVILVLICIISFFDLLFFREMTITQNHIIKKYYFFSEFSLDINNLKVIKSNSQSGGFIAFYNGKSRFDQIIFRLDILATKKQDILKLKKKLLIINAIKGDENEWND